MAAIVTKPDRRFFLRSMVAGSVLMPGIVSQLLAESAASAIDPLAPKLPHHRPRANRIIVLHMSGGVSHVDTFDHKPKLYKDHGKEVKLDHPQTQNRPGYERLFLKTPQ